MRREYRKTIGGGVLPDGYAECEYIESHSNITVGSPDIQYIDTEYSLQEEYIRFVSKARWVTNEGGSIIGSRLGNNGFQLQCYASNKCFRLYNGAATLDTENNSCIDGTDYEIDVILNGRTQTINYDDKQETISNRNLTPIVSGLNIGLFACIRDTIASQSKSRIYSMKIYERNDVIVRDYIPVIRVSDNKPGMYDLCGSICPLTDTPFYVNAGSGEFLYKLK